MSDDYLKALEVLRSAVRIPPSEKLQYFLMAQITQGEFTIRVITENRRHQHCNLPYIGTHRMSERTYVTFSGDFEQVQRLSLEYDPEEPSQLYRVTLPGAKLIPKHADALVTGVTGGKGQLDALKAANETVRVFSEVDHTLAAPAFAALLEQLGDLRVFDTFYYLEFMHEIHRRLNYREPFMNFTLFNSMAPLRIYSDPSSPPA